MMMAVRGRHKQQNADEGDEAGSGHRKEDDHGPLEAHPEPVDQEAKEQGAEPARDIETQVSATKSGVAPP